MEIEMLDPRHNLRLRKTPLTAFILRSAYELQIDPKRIREELGKVLKVSNSRISQFENILIEDTGRDKINKQQIETINAFFTELLGERIDIAAAVGEAGVGLFSDLV